MREHLPFSCGAALAYSSVNERKRLNRSRNRIRRIRYWVSVEQVELAQERVRRNSKKKRRDIQRRTRGSASLPAPAKWLGPIIAVVHTNDSTLTRNKGLLHLTQMPKFGIVSSIVRRLHLRDQWEAYRWLQKGLLESLQIVKE